MLCCRLYNTALEQRKTAYERRRISLSRYDQEAELKEIRAALSEYNTIHSYQVVTHCCSMADGENVTAGSMAAARIRR